MSFSKKSGHLVFWVMLVSPKINKYNISLLSSEDYICLSFTKPVFWKCWADISQFKFQNSQKKNGLKKAWIFWFVFHRYCNTKCYLYNISFPTVLIQASITAYSTNLHEKLSKCLGLKLAIIHQLTLFACAIIWCHLLMHSNEKIFVWGM